MSGARELIRVPSAIPPVERQGHFARVTMLEDASWFVPFVETWTQTKLPWASTPAVYRYEEFPPVEDYAKLTIGITAFIPSSRRPRCLCLQSWPQGHSMHC
jgi:hypothetical protein